MFTKSKELVKALEKKNSELTEELANKTNQLKLKDEEMDKFKIEASAKSEECAVKTQSLMDELEKKGMEANKYKAEASAKSEEIAVTADKIQSLTDELDKKNKEAEKYKAEATAKSEEVAAISKEVALKDARISELENKNHSLIKNNETLSKSVASLGEMNSDETFDTTIRARFTQISKLSAERVCSRSIRFAGADWKMYVYKNGDYLNFRLNGMKNNDAKWSCSLFYEFQLISHNSEKIIHRRGGEEEACTFTNGIQNWGYPEFISFKNLFDEEKGYVKDDSILVAVVLKAFPSAPSN